MIKMKVNAMKLEEFFNMVTYVFSMERQIAQMSEECTELSLVCHHINRKERTKTIKQRREHYRKLAEELSHVFFVGEELVHLFYDTVVDSNGTTFMDVFNEERKISEGELRLFLQEEMDRRGI
jgi:hypothetical protein